MAAKSLDERRADSLEKLALGLALAAFVGAVPVWARVFLMALAIICYVMSELFARSGGST